MCRFLPGGFGASFSFTSTLPAIVSSPAPSDAQVRGSIFNLCSATLGAGALSLPYAFSKTGVWLGIVLLVVAGIATLFSIHLLIVARNATGLKSYEDMTVALFG